MSAGKWRCVGRNDEEITAYFNEHLEEELPIGAVETISDGLYIGQLLGYRIRRSFRELHVREFSFAGERYYVLRPFEDFRDAEEMRPGRLVSIDNREIQRLYVFERYH